TPYFSPGTGTLVAAGVTAEGYRDTTTAGNRGYYYRVLAEDGTTENNGPANGGNLDRNAAFAGVTPTSAASVPGIWSDDVDGTVRLSLEAPWRVTNQSAHTGLLAYHAGPDGSDYPPNTCAS